MANFDPKQSVAKTLFVGGVLEENIYPFPNIKESEKETLLMVLDSIGKFLDPYKDKFKEFDHEGRQSDEFIQGLRDTGLFGLIIPEEYGGIGLSNSAYARVIQQTTRHDASTSLTIGAHSSIGMKGLLLFGNKEQKEKYLPKLASGEMIAAFCLTEPGAGSDAASLKTNAVKQSDGSWILNGSKIWITNGGLAGFFTVFAKTDSEHGKLSAFIVEAKSEGVSVGKKEDKLGIRASMTNAIEFTNVRVPAANLLGEEGHGFKIAMAILNNGRTGLGGGSVGAMKKCIDLALEQSAQRKQFGKSINEFGLVKEKIAQMTLDCFVTESVVWMVAHYIDSGAEDCSVEAAMSKIIASENLWKVVNEALQIAGGNGFMKEYPYEMVMRDSRINMIFEGTNEILRLYIALSGFKLAGDYLKDIGSNVTNFFNDPIKGFGVLSGYASKKVTQLTPIGRVSIKFVGDELKDAASVLQQYTPVFSQVVEALLKKLGKNIVGAQYAQKRIADVATDLFSLSCILSRVQGLIEKNGAENCVDEISMCNIFSQQAKRRINQNLRRIDKNEDDEITALADKMIGEGRYKWDVLS